MSENYKGALQEYCQRHGLPFPKYGIEDQIGPSHCPEFQAYVRLGHEEFVGNDSCSTLIAAEQSAAKVAYSALDFARRTQSSRQPSSQRMISNNPFQQLALPPPPASAPPRASRSMKHMPDQHRDTETFIINIIRLDGGRIRKIWAPNKQRKYQFEITGTYRYCENIGRHHKKNHIYFLVDPDRRTYCQGCHDPACSDFQSPTRAIWRNDRDEPGKRKSTSSANDHNPFKREKYYSH